MVEVAQGPAVKRGPLSLLNVEWKTFEMYCRVNVCTRHFRAYNTIAKLQNLCIRFHVLHSLKMFWCLRFIQMFSITKLPHSFLFSIPLIQVLFPYTTVSKKSPDTQWSAKISLSLPVRCTWKSYYLSVFSISQHCSTVNNWLKCDWSTSFNLHPNTHRYVPLFLIP